MSEQTMNPASSLDLLMKREGEIRNLDDCALAFGRLETYSKDVQTTINKWKGSLAHVMRREAAVIYTRFFNDRAKYVVNGEEVFNIVASEQFQELADAAQLKAINSGLSEKLFKNWKQYTANLVAAMELSKDGEFIARDEAGEFELNGMNSITEFSKKKREAMKEEAKATRAAELKKQGVELGVVKPEPKVQAEAATAPEGQAPAKEVPGGSPMFSQEVQEKVETLILQLAELAETDQAQALSVLELCIEKVTKRAAHVANTQLQKAAAAARQAAAA